MSPSARQRRPSVGDGATSRRRARILAKSLGGRRLSTTDFNETSNGDQSTSTPPSSQPGPGLPAVPHIATPSSSTSQPRQIHQDGANVSLLGFALDYLDGQDESSGDASTIPGQTGGGNLDAETWSLQSLQLPPRSILEPLIDAYFERSQWFLLLFHQESFCRNAKVQLSKARWRRSEKSSIVVILLVVAHSLLFVRRDESWPFYQLMEQLAYDPNRLITDIVSEARKHMTDILEDNDIGSVQACILLGTYHVYYGSANAAWFYLGSAVRAAYGISIHCESGQREDQSVDVQKMCWNQVIIADTFASLVYGRPSSLDPAFSKPRVLLLPEDSVLSALLSRLPGLSPSTSPITRLTFHELNNSLYGIIRQALTKFRCFANGGEISESSFQKLTENTKAIQGTLRDWRAGLPPVFRLEDWPKNFIKLRELLTNAAETHEETKTAKDLLRQVAVMQLTYDSAVILACRPLLNRRLSASVASYASRLSLGSFPNVLKDAVSAALRISHMPIDLLRRHSAMSLLTMHFFTAGVILCIPPTSLPNTSFSSKAKEGAIRVIRVSRKLKETCRISRHNEKLLTQLLRLTVQREMENMLSADDASPRETFQGQPKTSEAFDLAGQIYKAHASDVLVDEHGPQLETPSTDWLSMMATPPPLVADRDVEMNRGGLQNCPLSLNSLEWPQLTQDFDSQGNDGFNTFSEGMFSHATKSYKRLGQSTDVHSSNVQPSTR